VLFVRKNGELQAMESTPGMKVPSQQANEFLKSLIACGSWTSLMTRVKFVLTSLSKLHAFQRTYMQCARVLTCFSRIMTRCILLKEYLSGNHWLRTCDMNLSLVFPKRQSTTTKNTLATGTPFQRLTMSCALITSMAQWKMSDA